MTIARYLFAIALILFAAAASARAAEPAGSGEPAWLGAQVETVTPQLMAKHKLLLPFGALVTGIAADSPARKADIRIGDVIISIGAKPVVTADMLTAALKELAPGTKVTIARARITTKSVTVTLAAKPKPKPAKPKAPLSPPLLMLDTGGHMALIKNIMFTPDGRLLVSAGDDKVIRVWDWRKGKTIRTIRGQSAPGQAGSIVAMALSPDGKLLAAGGRLATFNGRNHSEVAAIRLYDFTSGKLLAQLKGHENVINALTFSPDGRRLISGSGDFNAILWDVARPDQPKLLHRLKGHKNDIYAVGFTPDGKRVVTGSFDHNLRMWRVADGKLLKTMTGHRDKVRALAINRKTGAVASGDDSGEIRLWDGKTGSPLRSPSSPARATRPRGEAGRRARNLLGKTKGLVAALAFSPDGTRLLSTCGSSRCSYTQTVWNTISGKQQSTYRGHDNVVGTAAISPDGKWAATGGGENKEINVWALADGRRFKDRDGKNNLTLKGSGSNIWAAGFSKDGRVLVWGAKWTRNHSSHGYGPLQYGLPLPLNGAVLGVPVSLSTTSNTPPQTRSPPRGGARTRDKNWKGGYNVGVAKFGKWSLTHRPGGGYGYKDAILDISNNGKVVASITRGSTNGYVHSAYSFTPKGKTIVTGGAGGVLQSYNRAGKRMGRFIGHLGDVLAVTPSPDGQLLVSSSADQTVKLWNLKTRELIVTLFHGRDGEWVLWTPQGYFTGSPGGAKLVGWQINKGPAKAAAYVTGQQLREKLYRPDIVSRSIQLASAKAALKEAGLGKVSVADILTKLPPEIRAAADAQASGGSAIIGLQFGKNDLPVTAVSFFVSNGKTETKVKAEPLPLPGEAAALKAQGYDLRAYRVPLFTGTNNIRVVATNRVGESAPALVSVQHNGEGALDKRGTLWLLAVGVDNYPGAPGIYGNLRFAGADAKAFAATVTARMTGLHDDVKVTLLVNGGDQGEPTRANILRALEGIARHSRATDTVMLFFAGHGENWKGGRYHFLPTDFVRKSRDNIGRNVIDWAKTIQGTITAARGRRLVFVDACRAGTAHFNAKLLGDALADRFVAFAASAANQDAYEFASEGHGAFTATLLAGFKGKARDPARRAVTVYRLGTYVNEAVSARTQGRQTPEYQSGQGNFILAR